MGIIWQCRVATDLWSVNSNLSVKCNKTKHDKWGMPVTKLHMGTKYTILAKETVQSRI